MQLKDRLALAPDGLRLERGEGVRTVVRPCSREEVLRALVVTVPQVAVLAVGLRYVRRGAEWPIPCGLLTMLRLVRATHAASGARLATEKRSVAVLARVLAMEAAERSDEQIAVGDAPIEQIARVAVGRKPQPFEDRASPVVDVPAGN